MAESNIKRQQMEYIAIGILVLAAVVMGVTRFQKKDRDDEVFSRSKFNERWAGVEILEAKVPKEEKGVVYSVESQRIPFKSPFEDKDKTGLAEEDIMLPAMTFQGMVWNSIRPQAIINNKVYDINDIIEVGAGEDKAEIRVKDVTREGIFLRYKGKEFIVRPK